MRTKGSLDRKCGSILFFVDEWLSFTATVRPATFVYYHRYQALFGSYDSKRQGSSLHCELVDDKRDEEEEEEEEEAKGEFWRLVQQHVRMSNETLHHYTRNRSIREYLCTFYIEKLAEHFLGGPQRLNEFFQTCFLTTASESVSNK